VSPRLNQTALALLSLVDDDAMRERIAAHIVGADNATLKESTRSIEADLITTILDAFHESQRPAVGISEITDRLNNMSAQLGHLPVTPKWVGSLVRRKLGVEPAKSHGVYVIPPSERQRIEAIARRRGIVPSALSTAQPDTVSDVGPCSNSSDRESISMRQ
jgi:hypothetical protein